MKRWSTVIAVLSAGVALSGCTLVGTTTPVRITTQIPFGLPNKTIPGTNGARVRFVTQPVYFIDATDNLAPSSRIVTYPPALDTVISQLILGPTDIERSAGYSSDLPKKLVLLSAKVHGEVGYVNFATPLSSLPREEQVLAVGQLVLTAYYSSATQGIVIKVAGVTQHVLTPNGTRTTLATPRAFESLLDD
ncbi:MAG TPA: GerMN domain-containing protein [Acidimicrobiales bacterium]|nr:GerMN domain-containing protein [Acidimicrobiales bacterium]